MIDPDNHIAEENENNNILHSWVEVQPYIPADTVAPVINNVTMPATIYSPYLSASVYASDPPPASGVSWLDLVIWEFFPSSGSWLALDESGWMPAHEGANFLSYSLYDWSGPRFVEIYAADAAQNVSRLEDSWMALTNYIKADSFIFPGESQWYLYWLEAGEALNASLSVGWPDPDLYVWPPDYPARNPWVSANDGYSGENISMTAPVSGYYWVEVYGYADYGTYTLTVNAGNGVQTDSVSVPREKPSRLPPIDLSAVPPRGLYRLSPIRNRIYLPSVIR